MKIKKFFLFFLFVLYLVSAILVRHSKKLLLLVTVVFAIILSTYISYKAIKNKDKF